MKMHKTILTLLLTMLAVIGTTGTVAHADEPDGDLDHLTPENVLTDEEVTMWNGLDLAKRALVQNEVIPTLADSTLPSETQVKRLRGIIRGLYQMMQEEDAAGAKFQRHMQLCDSRLVRRGREHLELPSLSGERNCVCRSMGRGRSDTGFNSLNVTWCDAYVEEDAPTPCQT